MKDTYKLMKDIGVDYWKMAPVMNTGNWKNQTAYNPEIKEIFDAFLDLIALYKADNAPMRLSTGALFHSLKNSGSSWNNSFEKFDGTPGILNQFSCKTCKDCIYMLPDGRILPCISFSGTTIENTAPSVFETPLADLLSGYFDNNYRSKIENIVTCTRRL